ncbi:TfoX/Sxy family protein [Sinanaerobacter sp. ZZT-01]|uniref:TfoX/Sxy family protein n=1 Tax=Sinanaerobacter sp. ZZT-01 TaxID=3111540 RepID=UPI002D77E8FE|nr:TfoX/Sxy family protein [Sinanaerobacter sp. ZZT-01]WRR93654.1 TfoX/Sxy family protein [Sinanaerobacter sp. ZZT-01]
MMASSLEFIEYVVGQVEGSGLLRYRKMFGEYMVYVDDKPVLLVCDNMVFVKKLDCIAEKMKQSQSGFPYQGAKEYYILDIDNSAFSREIVETMLPFVSVPKPRKRKEPKKAEK